MSRSVAFVGSLTATRTGFTTKYITPDMADFYRLLDYTVNGTTHSNPIRLADWDDITTVAYGASWMMDWQSTVDWHSRVRERMGFGSHVDLGIEGSDSLQVSIAVTGSYTNAGINYRWTPGRSDIVFLQTGIGIDQFYPASSDASVAKMSYDSFICTLATLDGQAHQEITSGGVGTWATSAAGLQWSGGDDNGGTYYYTRTAGDYIDLSITGPAVDIAVVTGSGEDILGTNDPMTCPAIVYVDGVQVSGSPFETNARVYGTPSISTNFGHRMIRLRNMGPGSHTVRLQAGTGPTSDSYFGVDYYMYPSETPPIIVALKEMWLDLEGAVEADYDLVMAQYDQAVADHRLANPNTRLVVADVSAGWPHPSYLGTDNLHPKQAGHDWMASVAMKAMLKEGPAVFV